MDKRRAIQIMTKAAQLYKEHLEDQKVLFLYGLPKEVNKQLQESNKILSSVQGYEVVFHRYNFLHLTGVRLNKKETASAIHLICDLTCIVIDFLSLHCQSDSSRKALKKLHSKSVFQCLDHLAHDTSLQCIPGYIPLRSEAS